MRWLLLAPSDRTAFQQSFNFLAESQFYVDPASRAALVRFAYREALRTHDAAWAARVPRPQYLPCGDR